jgi:hypothetical protein
MQNFGQMMPREGGTVCSCYRQPLGPFVIFRVPGAVQRRLAVRR